MLFLHHLCKCVCECYTINNITYNIFSINNKKNGCIIMEHAISKNGISIRLTNERWIHIIIGHPELIGYHIKVLETIKDPEAIYAGRSGECIAIKNIKNEKYMVVIYKELNNDGFVITAFKTNHIKKFKKRRVIWGN